MVSSALQVRSGAWALWPRTSGSRAWILVCGAAITFAGLGMLVEIADSVNLFRTPPSGEGGGAAEAAVRGGALFAVCGALACGGVLGVRQRLEQVQRAVWHTPAISRGVAAFAAFGAAMSVSWIVQNATDFLDSTTKSSSLDSANAGIPLQEIVAGVAAGFWEEPLFAALPTLLAAVTHRALLLPLIAISAVLRGALHLYQGWLSCLLAVGWGVVAALAFAAIGALSGLIAAHALTNLTVAGPWWDDAWALILPASAVLVAVIWSVRNRKTLRIDVRFERGRRTRVMTLPMVTLQLDEELPDGRAEYAVEFLDGRTAAAAATSWLPRGQFVWLEHVPSDGAPPGASGAAGASFRAEER